MRSHLKLALAYDPMISSQPDAGASDGFLPDSPLVSRIAPSPNVEPRRDAAKPIILLLHYTGMSSAELAIQRLASPSAKVSAHYVIGLDGEIVQMAHEDLRAWHAGVAQWRDIKDINSHSIGIEIQNSGHDGNFPPFPDNQIDAVIALSADVIARHRIRPHFVLGHSDTSPRRKKDPGQRFPWDRLHRSGIGHWVTPAPIVEGPALEIGDVGIAVMRLQRQLQAYGYGIETSGEFDEHTMLVVEAFQRHFRPALVDGRADISTVDTLDRLLEELPAVS